MTPEQELREVMDAGKARLLEGDDEMVVEVRRHRPIAEAYVAAVLVVVVYFLTSWLPAPYPLYAVGGAVIIALAAFFYRQLVPPDPVLLSFEVGDDVVFRRAGEEVDRWPRQTPAEVTVDYEINSGIWLELPDRRHYLWRYDLPKSAELAEPMNQFFEAARF